jgi:hypothetical protein
MPTARSLTPSAVITGFRSSRPALRALGVGCLFILASLCGTLTLCAADAKSDDAARTARIDALLQSDTEAWAGNDAVLVCRGVVADRAARRVVIHGEATGLQGGDTAEFWLIGPGSGHGYEALALSYAAASDVHAALEFIGMKPGRPFDASALCFWPKGERVMMSFRPAGNTNAAPVRAESLIYDKRSSRPMRETGFVFVGSRLVEDEASGEKGYAADIRDPRSIASNYNEQDTVLDVPRQSLKGEVYEKQIVNESGTFTNGQPLEIILTPELAPGATPRVCDISLRVTKLAGAGTDEVGALRFRASRDGEDWLADVQLSDLLGGFAKLVEAARDPYVTLEFGADVSLGLINKVCTVLSSVETETGIRVDPPPEGQLYYRAFIPNEQFRDRAKRYAQPRELILRTGEDGAISAEVVTVTQTWHEDRLQPDLSIATTPVGAAADLPGILGEKPELPVLLVFASPGVTHGQLMAFVGPVLSSHPNVHVYLGEPQ